MPSANRYKEANKIIKYYKKYNAIKGENLCLSRHNVAVKYHDHPNVMIVFLHNVYQQKNIDLSKTVRRKYDIS